MKTYDLAILIPARNEMFLKKTVESILKNKRGNTEILIGLDGAWADPAIPDHEDITILYSPESLGQRKMTNQLCRLTQAKYVMKIDAHCTVDEGFDVKLLADMQDDWTVIPALYNLHAFDWVCIGSQPRTGVYYLDPESGDVPPPGCGHKIYQGPTPEKCEKCGGNMERVLVFKPRLSKRSEFYRFDKGLHFQYWGAFKERPEAQGDLAPSLSAQGSCFLLTREKYWELDICDEGHGSWGQQGTEVACKTWLSGGKLMINKKTWYSHMFRTQGGDFGFPYALSGSDQEKAREYSRKLWLENTWPKAKHDLNWLLEKFRPVPDWHDNSEVNLPNASETEIQEGGPSRGIIFYTDNQLTLKIARAVQKRLKEVGLPIVSASLKPMPHFGTNIHIPRERGVETYFMQIIAALSALDTDIVYFCEHDVIYHKSHFDFIPPNRDLFYYNQNFWKVRDTDGFAVHWDANQVSGLVCDRKKALEYYKQRLTEIRMTGFNRSYEPGGRDKSQYEVFNSQYPNIDMRHEGTLTRSKWSPNDFRDKSTCVNWQEGRLSTIPGWNIPSDDVQAFLASV